MKVLIVEDQSSKASSLTAAVEGAGVAEEDVVIVPDAAAARTHLTSEAFDVLLLDLQIPKRFGEGASQNGGADLLKWMTRRPPQSIPVHILAITAYDIEEDSVRELAKFGVSCIRYEPSQDLWKEHVRGLVARANLRQAPATVNRTEVRISAVVLTVVDVEFAQAKRVFDVSGGGEVRAGVRWFRAEVRAGSETRHVVLAQATQMGMPAAAVLATKALRVWDPALVIMPGVCAGYRGEVNLGDIIVADPCWDYGSGKLGADGLLRPDPRALPLPESTRLLVLTGRDQAPLSEWRQEWWGPKPDTVPRVHVMPAVSGAAVLADKETADHIKDQGRKVVGIDMENYGVYFACANSGLDRSPGFCAVKAVVDFADPTKSDSVHEYSAHLSARFARWLVENM